MTNGSRDLLFEMHCFSGWEAPELGVERPRKPRPQREPLDPALDALNRFSVLTTLAEKPLLRELDEAATA